MAPTLKQAALKGSLSVLVGCELELPVAREHFIARLEPGLETELVGHYFGVVPSRRIIYFGEGRVEQQWTSGTWVLDDDDLLDFMPVVSDMVSRLHIHTITGAWSLEVRAVCLSTKHMPLSSPLPHI